MILGVAVVAIAAWWAVAPPWVIAAIPGPNSGSAAAGSGNLNPTKYVDSIWASRLLPTVERSAIELPQLISDLKADPAGAIKQFGNVPTVGGPAAFIVKGVARVVSEGNGFPQTVSIAMGPSDRAIAAIQVGPILLGTDVRDAMRFINFNQFLNQVNYGEVALAINTRILQTTLDRLDVNGLKGRVISFTGAFTYSSLSAIVITPITIEVSR
jgi:predicted lipoprotein